MLSSSFIKYIVKETSTSSTVIISFESYCKNSLKALTRERRKGDHLSVQYDLIESAQQCINKRTFITRKNKIEILFLEKQIVNHLKNQDMSFVVVANSNGTIHVVSNNHEESDTIMRYCLGLVNLGNKVVSVKSNDTEIFTIMLGNYKKLNGLTLLIAWSNEKWINLTEIYDN